jgi:hypothetical protein
MDRTRMDRILSEIEEFAREVMDACAGVEVVCRNKRAVIQKASSIVKKVGEGKSLINRVGRPGRE